MQGVSRIYMLVQSSRPSSLIYPNAKDDVFVQRHLHLESLWTPKVDTYTALRSPKLLYLPVSEFLKK